MHISAIARSTTDCAVEQTNTVLLKDQEHNKSDAESYSKTLITKGANYALPKFTFEC